VPGETIATAIAAVRALNDDGLTATLDFLGEDVTDRAEAERTRDIYLAMLEAIRASGVRSNVSVKLTALGMALGEELAATHLREILTAAADLADPFVRIDMEGSAVTSGTLAIFERVYAEHRNVGPVIQAYLRRSPTDVERAIELGARVRLCKGAYREPESLAYPDMPTIRREYLRLAEALLSRGNYPGIATHDLRLIDAVRAYAREHGIAPDRFEFQMLYGIRPELQRELARAGYRMRVYVPFGTHWAGYFYRRIAERKENALFVLRSLVQR
ncbi:MAG: proline dehydrogenase family protein, partial [Vulcanimicrobiaceae bacterium]